MLDLFYFETTTTTTTTTTNTTTTTTQVPIPERIWKHVDPPKWSSLDHSQMDLFVSGQPQEVQNWDAMYWTKTLGAQILWPCEMPNNSSTYRGKHTKVNILLFQFQKKKKPSERYFHIGKVISSFTNKCRKRLQPSLVQRCINYFTLGHRPPLGFH